MISVQSSPIRAAPPDRRGPALRLRMKPAGALRGHIAGGWWPRSNDPAIEFPALVSALGAWVGPVERISSDLDTWAAVARKAPVNGKAVRFEGFHWIAPKNAGKPKGATSAGRTSWNPAYRGDIEELADIGLIRSVSDSASPACAPSPSQCACRAILNPTVHGHDGAAPTCPKRMVAPIRDRLADSEVRTLMIGSDYDASQFTISWDHVEEEEQRLLAQRLAGWQEKYPDVRVDRVVLRDRPVRALMRFGEQAQLLVVGSHGHGGFAGMLLGSTSQALVYHAPCPLAIVRP